jgi:hypothetical protein
VLNGFGEPGKRSLLVVLSALEEKRFPVRSILILSCGAAGTDGMKSENRLIERI